MTDPHQYSFYFLFQWISESPDDKVVFLMFFKNRSLLVEFLPDKLNTPIQS